MTLSLNNKIDKLFLSKITPVIETELKVDIILSPEFYWIREFDIPVKSIRQAVPLLPTLFEDILPPGNFSFQAVKKGTKFLCFAYDDKEILNFLNEINVNSTQINAFYFSQLELTSYERFDYYESSFIYSKDKILIKIPKEFSSKKVLNKAEEITNKLETLNLSKTKANIKVYTTFLDIKYIKVLIVFLAIVFFINIVNYQALNVELNKADKRYENIKKRYKLPASIIQTNALLDNLSSKVIKEIKLRTAIKYISNYNKKFSTSKLEKLSYKDGLISIKFKKVLKKDLQNYLTKKYKIIKSKETKESVSIEVSI